MTPRRLLIATLLVAYVIPLVWILFTPHGSTPAGIVLWTADAVHALGVPETVAMITRVEFGLNVVLMVPVFGLASLMWPRWTWRDWTTLGFIVSGIVELLQGFVLPERAAAFSDVVANTLGALIGAFLARGVNRLLG